MHNLKTKNKLKCSACMPTIIMLTRVAGTRNKVYRAGESGPLVEGRILARARLSGHI